MHQSLKIAGFALLTGLPMSAWAAPVEIDVWGDASFEIPAPPLALTVDADGRVCTFDPGGVSCFDPTGQHDWSLDLTDRELVDVVVGDGEFALFTSLDTLMIPRDGGATTILDASTSIARRDDGELIRIGGPDGVPVPRDYELAEVLAAPDGRIGLFDAEGDLLWVDADGTVLGAQELGLPATEGLRATPTTTGWAVIDDEGVVLLDHSGTAYGALDVPVFDLAPFQDGLLLADGQAVYTVDLVDGELEALAVDWPALRVGVSPDGGRLAAARGESRRLRVWEGDERIGAIAHDMPVVKLVGDADGGALTLDSEGLALRWNADGRATVLADRVLDLTLDRAGAAWLVLPDRVERHHDGQIARLDRAATAIVPVADGVAIAYDTTLERLAPDGGTHWTTQAEPGLLTPSEGVLTVSHGATVDVIDVESGVRRRRLHFDGLDVSQVGVAVGGLYAAGWRGDLPITGRPPELTNRRGLGAMTTGPWLSPDGRWTLWVAEPDRLIVADHLGRALHAGQAEGDITSAAVDAERLWIGRRDGRVERWTLGDVLNDVPVPPFDSYAQLEPFTPPPEPSEPTRDSRVGAVQSLAGTADGDLAIRSGALAIRDASGSSRIPVFEGGGRATAIHASAPFGLLVGLDDGRVLQHAEAEAPSVIGQAPAPITALCARSERVLAATEAGLYWLEPARAARRARPEIASAVACDPEDRWVAALVDGEAIVWNPKTNQVLARPRHAGPITALAHGGAGTLLTGGADEIVIAWETSRWTAGAVLEGHEGAVRSLLPLQRGRYVLVAAGERAVLWDLYSGEALRVVDLGESAIATASLPGGRGIVGGDRGRLIEIALPSRAERAPIPTGTVIEAPDAPPSDTLALPLDSDEPAAEDQAPAEDEAPAEDDD